MAALLDIVDEVFPIERLDVERARRIVLATRFSARDAIHLAIARRRGVDRILTFDRAFGEAGGIERYVG
jgi:predicted nucleic acid-binding protein